MNKPSWVTVGVVFAVSVATCILLSVLLNELDWSMFYRASLPYLGGLLLMSALNIALYTLEVYVLLRSVTARASIGQVYLILTASMSANYVTPIKVGIPLRVYLYNRFMAVPVGMGTAIVAIETLLGMIIPAFLSILGVLFLFPEISILIPMVLLIVLSCGIGVILKVNSEHVSPLISGFLPVRLRRRTMRFLRNLHIGLHSLPRRALVAVVAILLFSFLVTSVRLCLILGMLGYQSRILDVFFARVISITAGSISLIPMGLGVRDASVTFLLTKLGIPAKIALSTAMIERVFSPGFPLLLGLISANILGVSEITKQLEVEGADGDQTM